MDGRKFQPTSRHVGSQFCCTFAGNVGVNSCAGMVVDMINSTLSVDEIDKLTVLRMNKEFMEFMRKES